VVGKKNLFPQPRATAISHPMANDGKVIKIVSLHSLIKKKKSYKLQLCDGMFFMLSKGANESRAQPRATAVVQQISDTN
jgi:hypothetical protein